MPIFYKYASNLSGFDYKFKHSAKLSIVRAAFWMFIQDPFFIKITNADHRLARHVCRYHSPLPIYMSIQCLRILSPFSSNF